MARAATISSILLAVCLNLLLSAIKTETKSIERMRILTVHTKLESTLYKGKNPLFRDKMENVTTTQNIEYRENEKAKFSVALAKNEVNNQRPKSFQTFLTQLLNQEKGRKEKGIPIKRHSRRKRKIIKKVLLKILIFLKLMIKEFVFVSKKAALAAG